MSPSSWGHAEEFVRHLDLLVRTCGHVEPCEFVTRSYATVIVSRTVVAHDFWYFAHFGLRI